FWEGDPRPSSFEERRVYLGRVAGLDQAVAFLMRAPHSYTGEDVVEIHCHGGPFVLQALCEALLRAGSRLGEPGEFTKRAFLNGRLDLAQAEGVLDTIRAKTEGSLRVAQAQLQGTLSREIGRLREELIRVLAHVEAGIDFTEEDIAFIEANELTASLERTREAVGRLAESCTEGRVLREGVTVAIVGRPNVGKSSLLNALLQTDRAIVAPVPGTTRDVLEEVLNIRGVPVRLVDTAGVRETMDAVEQEGVRRTRAAMEAATLLLVLVDGSVPLTDEDHALLRSGEDQKRLVLLNKCDLAPALSDNERATLAAAPGVQQVLPISAKTGEGLDGLRDAIRNQVLRPDFEAEDRPIVTRLRHRAALLKADEALAHAAGSVAEGLSGEFIAVDVRAAVEALGEITGAVTTDDILDRIFREFCIGK
ncbi:MAG: tRNA uridine-5-carboxymethylaminomethyl(34) synthesis GTPase MnmE, partial [Nitrospirales bacterium]